MSVPCVLARTSVCPDEKKRICMWCVFVYACVCVCVCEVFQSNISGICSSTFVTGPTHLRWGRRTQTDSMCRDGDDTMLRSVAPICVITRQGSSGHRLHVRHSRRHDFLVVLVSLLLFVLVSVWARVCMPAVCARQCVHGCGSVCLPCVYAIVHVWVWVCMPGYV